ncbi:MAG: NADH-quinone oxidoreductase subunit N [Anaerolineae bacterium]|nr:NADH-quinone oxidoreductase subunit N [Anaerolineae bacterium]MDW8291850.1 NADH-quinone oxidoreductase subunit N [Anaerolineae bacterium]
MGGFTSVNPAEFLGILPEILLVLWASALFAIDLVAGQSLTRRGLGLLTAGGLAVILVITLLTAPTEPQTVLGGMVRNDFFTTAFRVIFIVGAALTALIGVDFRPMRAGGEFFVLTTFSAAAMSLMASANDIILLYLATETSSLSLYLLAGFWRGNKLSAEAALKYFVFGAVTSTTMLFGLSLLFGLSGGNTNYAAIGRALLDPALRVPTTLAALFVLVGFAFKTSAVPFHFWAPDVYHGAPTPVAGYISTASKAAGFAILLRFLFYTLPPGTSEASLSWATLMQPIAILTMVLGSLFALVQSDVKRMLAYSSVAQAGYVFVGVSAMALGTANRAEALAAVIFYLATYMLTNIAAFGALGMVEYRVGSTDLKAFNGLGRRAPYLALAMSAALLSLLGAPPMVGFVAKLIIFREAIGANLIGLVVIGIITVLISVAYYLNVVRAMYVERSEDEQKPLIVPAPTTVALSITATGVLALTVVSPPFWEIALQAARAFLGA